MIGWTQTYALEKIIVDPNAYTEKVKYRAVAVVVDVRRPNKVKPIYKTKRFVIRKPRAYRVKGVGLIVHPEIYDWIVRRMRSSITEQERRLVADILGVSSSQMQSSLTMANIAAALKLVKDADHE